MIIVGFSFCFLAAFVVLGLSVFPELRYGLRLVSGRLLHSGARVGSGLQRGTTTSAHAARSGLRGVRRAIARHRWTLLGMVLLLSFPSLVVMHMRGMLDFSHFHSQQYESNALVATLLRGEQLAPPQPLPPDVFTTRAVELLRPDLQRASRTWEKLKPEFRQRLLAVFERMQHEYGYQMVLLEGYRSPSRQRQLKSQGTYVTRAGAYESYHQFGLAADAAFFRDGKLMISRTDAWSRRGYELYGRSAQRVGLIWGGNWTLRDYGHVELHESGYDDPNNYQHLPLQSERGQ